MSMETIENNVKFVIVETIRNSSGGNTTTNYGPFYCDYSTILKIKEIIDDKNRGFGVAKTEIKVK